MAVPCRHSGTLPMIQHCSCQHSMSTSNLPVFKPILMLIRLLYFWNVISLSLDLEHPFQMSIYCFLFRVLSLIHCRLTWLMRRLCRRAYFVGSQTMLSTVFWSQSRCFYQLVLLICCVRQFLWRLLLTQGVTHTQRALPQSDRSSCLA